MLRTFGHVNPPRLGNLAHTAHGDAARQIQVVAEHHVGELLLACFANRLVESAFEPLAHLGRHVAIACCLVWHLVAHAAHGEGQLGRAEAHGMEGDAFGESHVVGNVDAGNERHFVSR